jgi:hypothetical protein
MALVRTHRLMGFGFVMFFALAATAQAQAQERPPEAAFQFEFRGETLVNVLDHIARETEIDLVYDPVLVRNIYVYQRLKHNTPQQLLSTLLKEYRLDYITLSSGTIVIVKSTLGNPAYGTFAGRITDKDTGEPLPGASVMFATSGKAAPWRPLRGFLFLQSESHIGHRFS